MATAQTSSDAESTTSTTWDANQLTIDVSNDAIWDEGTCDRGVDLSDDEDHETSAIIRYSAKWTTP